MGCLTFLNSRTATWENGEKEIHGDSGGGPVQNPAWQLSQGGRSGEREGVSEKETQRQRDRDIGSSFQTSANLSLSFCLSEK